MKKVLAIFLALCMLAGLCACDSGKSSDLSDRGEDDSSHSSADKDSVGGVIGGAIGDFFGGGSQKPDYSGSEDNSSASEGGASDNSSASEGSGTAEGSADDGGAFDNSSDVAIGYTQEFIDRYNAAISDLETAVCGYDVYDQYAHIYRSGNEALEYVYREFSDMRGFADADDVLAGFTLHENMYLGACFCANNHYDNDSWSEPFLIPEYDIYGNITALRNADIYITKTMDYRYGYSYGCYGPDVEYVYTYDDEGNYVLGYTALTCRYYSPVYIYPSYVDGRLETEYVQADWGDYVIEYYFDGDGRVNYIYVPNAFPDAYYEIHIYYDDAGRMSTVEISHYWVDEPFADEIVQHRFFYDNSGSLIYCDTYTTTYNSMSGYELTSRQDYTEYYYDCNGNVDYVIVSYGNIETEEDSYLPDYASVEYEFFYGTYYIYSGYIPDYFYY